MKAKRFDLKYIVALVMPMIGASKAHATGLSLENKAILDSESAEKYGIDYEALKQIFDQYKQTEKNEKFWMTLHEEEGFINFSSFDGISINTPFLFTPVEPNALGGGNK